MKIVFTLMAIVAMATSCSTNTSTESAKTETPADTTKIAYSYTINHPDEWEWGSRSNTQMVLKGLKAYENGNIEESVKDFADTVRLEFDHFETTVGKDSLIALLKSSRENLKNMSIKMDDFESVKSKDGKHEFVSLWYKQTLGESERKKGLYRMYG